MTSALMSAKGMTRCSSLLIAIALMLSALPKASSANVQPRASHIDVELSPSGDVVYPYDQHKQPVLESSPSMVVRRRPKQARDLATTKPDVFTQMQESITKRRMAGILACIGTLIFCTLAIWLTYAPLRAILEARAYEQAAKQALLEAAPPTDSGDAEALASQDQRSVRLQREEALDSAWETFIDNPSVRLSSSNLLARVMRELLSKPDIDTQLEDLFSALADEGKEFLQQAQLERACERLTGCLRNLYVKASVSQVEYRIETECKLASATGKDYGWLLQNYQAVFPENLPLDKKAFCGVVKLFIVWSCVRTLHLSRNTTAEAESTTEESSGKVEVDVKIDINKASPFEASAAIPSSGYNIVINRTESCENDVLAQDESGATSSDSGFIAF